MTRKVYQIWSAGSSAPLTVFAGNADDADMIYCEWRSIHYPAWSKDPVRLVQVSREWLAERPQLALEARKAARVGIDLVFYFLGHGAGWTGRPVSAQELIAHLAPANNVDDLMTWMGRAFDADFKAMLAQAVPPTSRHNVGDEGTALIVDDVPALLSALSELFRLRHILAHEAAPSLHISHGDTLRLIGAARIWIDGAQGTLWMTLWRDVPLTQMEMNSAAFTSVEVARSRLAQAMKSVRVHLQGQDRRALASNHRAWASQGRELVGIAYGMREGTMWRSVAANVIAAIFTERAAHIDGWASAYEPL